MAITPIGTTTKDQSDPVRVAWTNAGCPIDGPLSQDIFPSTTLESMPKEKSTVAPEQAES